MKTKNIEYAIRQIELDLELHNMFSKEQIERVILLLKLNLLDINKVKSKNYISCCSNCGKKRYTLRQETGAITMYMGICQICKKEKLIVPSNDWAFSEGDSTKWD